MVGRVNCLGVFSLVLIIFLGGTISPGSRVEKASREQLIPGQQGTTCSPRSSLFYLFQRPLLEPLFRYVDAN